MDWCIGLVERNLFATPVCYYSPLIRYEELPYLYLCFNSEYPDPADKSGGFHRWVGSGL